MPTSTALFSLRDAISAGARLILTDEVGADTIRESHPDFPLLVADDPRARVGVLSAWVYQNPSQSLKVIGITGTDGKTTTAMLAEAGLQAAGHDGLIGTIATRIGRDELPSVRTTPEAPELQALLAVMRERGVTAVVMEVSSHAIALGGFPESSSTLRCSRTWGTTTLTFTGVKRNILR